MPGNRTPCHAKEQARGGEHPKSRASSPLLRVRAWDLDMRVHATPSLPVYGDVMFQDATRIPQSKGVEPLWLFASAQMQKAFGVKKSVRLTL